MYISKNLTTGIGCSNAGSMTRNKDITSIIQISFTRPMTSTPTKFKQTPTNNHFNCTAKEQSLFPGREGSLLLLVEIIIIIKTEKGGE